MQSIQNIAREALRQLLQEGREPTPEAYAEYFYQQARKVGVSYEEQSSLKKMLEKFNEEVRENLANKDFKSKDELIIHLIVALNHIYFYKKNFTLYVEIIRILLRILATYPQREIASLAKGQLLEIDKSNPNIMQTWREKWSELLKKSPESEGERSALEIVSGFRIDNLAFQKWQAEVREGLESKNIKEAVFWEKLERVLRQELKPQESAIQETQKEPIKEAPKEKMQYKEVDSLPMDSMTTLVSKEGMQKVLEFAEEGFCKQGRNYALIAFGIIDYHKITAEYGSEAGKRILATLGRLLKEYSNPSDWIAYYGNEEFLACLLDREKSEAVEFIKKLDSVVEQSIFVYQQMRLHIKLSAQVSHRAGEASLEEALGAVLSAFESHKDTQGVINGE